jgi:hypothetical protein
VTQAIEVTQRIEETRGSKRPEDRRDPRIEETGFLEHGVRFGGEPRAVFEPSGQLGVTAESVPSPCGGLRSPAARASPCRVAPVPIGTCPATPESHPGPSGGRSADRDWPPRRTGCAPCFARADEVVLRGKLDRPVRCRSLPLLVQATASAVGLCRRRRPIGSDRPRHTLPGHAAELAGQGFRRGVASVSGTQIASHAPVSDSSARTNGRVVARGTGAPITGPGQGVLTRRCAARYALALLCSSSACPDPGTSSGCAP